VQTLMIVCWIVVIIIFIAAIFFGIKEKKGRDEAHKKWLKENHLTEEEARQKKSEFLEEEKKKKSARKKDVNYGIAFLPLSFKDRRVIVRTGKFFRDRYAVQDPNSEICCCFRRIASYPYVWLLSKQDVKKAVTAMESFSRMRKVNTAVDPKGELADIDNVIIRLKALKDVRPMYPEEA